MTTYYANVTFPSSALNIPAVRTIYRKMPKQYVLEQDSTVTFADPDADFGRIEFTDILDTLQVPYDHFHRNEAGRNVYTQQVRFVDGQRTMTIVRDADIAVKRYAQDLLDLLNAGQIEQVRSQLEYTVTKIAGPDISAVASSWDPEELYVLFNPVEASENDGAGYWSNVEGWVGVQSASIFTFEQRVVYETDENTAWQTLQEALSGFKVGAST